MSNETHHPQPKLSAAATAAILASGTSDGLRILEAVSDIVSGIILDNERKFSAQEWRAMADVLHDTTAHPPATLHLPQGMRGLERLLNLIQESEKYDGLSARMHISLEQIKNKIDTLDRRAVACMLATLEFGLQHYPTQLDSYAWWTLEARAEAPAVNTTGVASTDRRRKENKNATGKRGKDSKEAMTGRNKVTPPVVSNGQPHEVVAVAE